MTQAAAAESQQQHGQRVTLLAQLAEALEDLHLPAVDQAGAAGCHPGLADDARDLGAALDRRQDLGVEPIDLLAELVDLRLGGGQGSIGCAGSGTGGLGVGAHVVSSRQLWDRFGFCGRYRSGRRLGLRWRGSRSLGVRSGLGHRLSHRWQCRR
ncbi:hypothetical protein RHRU231_810004 [Rhodococcus ruber]|uniref:Uncharacterized protein n=1 Tax=Rhodococcus ruber TaxID=1830 RepID=A0A098BR54_9NOCA|nr:hypothetical protein RHRU231_810004 [Rhodococcus ruber]